MLGGQLQKNMRSSSAGATNPAESCRRLRARMGAQEEMQAQSLSSTRPWSAAAQEQSYSAFAKMAFQDGLVCSHKNQGADPSKCLLIAWKPKSKPRGNISWV